MAHAYVDFIRKYDGFCLLLGDNEEMGVPKKAHMMFEQSMIPQEQLDYAVELFQPIKRNIKGAVTSNHSWRAYHDAGLMVDKEMMSRLGIMHHYYGFQGVVDLRHGTQTYRIVFAHGNSAGKNVFANCEKMEINYPGADMYATSHTHVLACRPKAIHQYNGSKVYLKNYYHVSTGATLNYPLYASEALYQPQVKGFAIAWLYPSEHRIDVDVNGRIPGYDSGPLSPMVPFVPVLPKSIRDNIVKCPKCGGTRKAKNGKIVYQGKVKQRYDCADCLLHKSKKYRDDRKAEILEMMGKNSHINKHT